MKFYPKSRKYLRDNAEKYKEFVQVNYKKTAIEYYENGFIKFYLPLTDLEEFYSTTAPSPEMKVRPTRNVTDARKDQ